MLLFYKYIKYKTEGGLRRVGLEPLLLVPEPNPPLFVLRKTINESGVENARANWITPSLSAQTVLMISLPCLNVGCLGKALYFFLHPPIVYDIIDKGGHFLILFCKKTGIQHYILML